MRRIIPLCVLVLILASCQVIGGKDDDNQVEDGSTTNNNTAIINWDRSAAAVIFRAEVSGGDNGDQFYMKNEVYPCTVYGDGRIVWLVDNENGTQVLFDMLDDARIRRFVEDLTVQQEIYNYNAEADLDVPGSSSPVIEKLTLAVNDVVHVSDSFSDWDLNYFQTVVELCQGIAPRPTVFEPQNAWISVQQAEYNPNTPTILWDAEASGVDLEQLAASGSPEWISGRIVRIIWNLIRRSPPDFQFSQGSESYQVVLQVPDITVDSPPAPAEGESN